jgi:hypothetical protein
MSQKTKITPLTRLLFLQGGLCFFCKEPLTPIDASVEHLVAKANGGNGHDENCVVCCKSLNCLLGSMSLKEKIQVFLNQKGRFECPNGLQKKVTKTSSQSSQKKLAPERYAQVVANLKQRGKAKPSTIVKLKSTIAHLFQNKLSPDEVDALVEQLQSRHVISVSGSSVTYA